MPHQLALYESNNGIDTQTYKNQADAGNQDDRNTKRVEILIAADILHHPPTTQQFSSRIRQRDSLAALGKHTCRSRSICHHHLLEL